MTRRAAVAMLAAVALATACGSKTTTPTTPTNTVAAAPNIGTASAQSPSGNQLLGGLTVILIGGSATVDQSSFTLQYRFQILNDGGSLVEDSGLQSSTTYTSTKTLTPLSKFTWRVRAESQGYAGPWSSGGSFSTPDPPSPYNRPIGDWQNCGGPQTKKETLVGCVWNAVHPNDTVSDMEVVKRVAWLLRAENAGMLIKTGGDGVMSWQGYSFSASRICYPDGHLWKILSDAGPGGANGPQWSDNDTVDPTLYVKAIDPSKP